MYPQDNHPRYHHLRQRALRHGFLQVSHPMYHLALLSQLKNLQNSKRRHHVDESTPLAIDIESDDSIQSEKTISLKEGAELLIIVVPKLSK